MPLRLLAGIACVLGSVSIAAADPNDLSDGVLITHSPHMPTLTYGLDWCQAFDDSGFEFGISACEDQNNWMPVTYTSDDPYMFYVVAAWREDKQWCGTEFGFSADFNELWYFSSYGPCLSNCLEASTTGWPGAGEGTAVMATDVSWEGNFRPIYYFVGYSYYESFIELDVNPAQDFVGFGNCDVPAVEWDAVCLGAVGIGDDVDGIYCCPPDLPPVYACCFEDGTCLLLTEYDCQVAGGIPWPPVTMCDPNPCLPCCDPGACCLETGECLYILEEECGPLGGDFLGELIECEPDNPCPTATGRQSWGSIKQRFK